MFSTNRCFNIDDLFFLLAHYCVLLLLLLLLTVSRIESSLTNPALFMAASLKHLLRELHNSFDIFNINWNDWDNNNNTRPAITCEEDWIAIWEYKSFHSFKAWPIVSVFFASCGFTAHFFFIGRLVLRGNWRRFL